MPYSVQGVYDKKYYFTSDVVYKKYKKLVYTPSDLLARICKVEDVCYFLGVHIFRLSTRCKMFHSKITYPFPQKSHECALKLTDLWITSLLFDLKYKFVNGSFRFSPG